MGDTVSKPVTDSAQRDRLILKIERMVQDRASLRTLLKAAAAAITDQRRSLRVVQNRIRRHRQREIT